MMSNQLKVIILKKLQKSEERFVDTPILIPAPKEISLTEEKNTFFLTSECNIEFINAKNCDLLVNDLNEFLSQISNIKLAIIKDKVNNLEKKLDYRDLLDIKNEEGYNLEIKNSLILIYSIHEKGMFYGIQTLIQLLKNEFLTNERLRNLPAEEINKLILPEIFIRDTPDLKIRGITQDISRGQVFTVENAKRYIKILSHYKMNTYGITYLGDVFAHPRYPEIGKGRGALTIREIKEIDEYAKSRNVDFIPIFQCLGHNDDVLMHSKYRHLGEFPGAQSFDISNPDIINFLNDYITEVSKTFSSDHFHIACDESFDVGKYNSKDFIKRKGKSEVLTEFYNKIHHLVRESGKIDVIMYDDIVRNNEYVLKNLNKEFILMYWDYAPRKSYPTLKKLLDAGYRVIVSPSMLNWQRNFPDNKNASKNIINFIKAAYNNRFKGCLGVLTSTWGDMRYYSFRENEIFGAVLNGALAWKTLDFNYPRFKADFGFLFYGIEKSSLKKFNEMFSLLSKSASLYYRLSVLLPPLFFTYFFKHPFPTKIFKPPFENFKKLGDLANICLALYNELKTKIVFEIDNFEYIEFGAELAKYLREKIDISQEVSDVLNKSEINDIDIQKIKSDLNYIKDKMIYLKIKYEKLWLRAAKRPCLDLILKLFDFLIKVYEKKISQINNRIFFEDPYIKSEWIWSSDINKSTNARYFRKEININRPIKKAIIQGIACNYMRIYINNEYIGDVISRYSMSILPIALRVKAFDITRNLKIGENLVAIEAYNFDGLKGAINIYGQILYDDDTISELKTDNTWSCTSNISQETNNWRKLNYGRYNWTKSQSYGRPPNLNGDIFSPDLLNCEISNTQDYFGIEGYVSNFIKEKDETKIEHMINIFKPYGN